MVSSTVIIVIIIVVLLICSCCSSSAGLIAASLNNSATTDTSTGTSDEPVPLDQLTPPPFQEPTPTPTPEPAPVQTPIPTPVQTPTSDVPFDLVYTGTPIAPPPPPPPPPAPIPVTPQVFQPQPQIIEPPKPTFDQFANTNLVSGRISDAYNSPGFKYYNRTDNENDCQNKCANDTNCIAYTWHNSNCGGWSNSCYGVLKGTTYNKSGGSCHMSGIKRN